MRNITTQASLAFIKGEGFTKANTAVIKNIDGSTKFYLHGNEIAHKRGSLLMLTLAGWNTATTRERLNGLLSSMGLTDYGFTTKQGQAIFTGSNDNKYKIDDNATIAINTETFNIVITGK